MMTMTIKELHVFWDRVSRWNDPRETWHLVERGRHKIMLGWVSRGLVCVLNGTVVAFSDAHEDPDDTSALEMFLDLVGLETWTEGFESLPVEKIDRVKRRLDLHAEVAAAIEWSLHA